MFIKKSNKGFGWFSTVTKDNKGNKLDVDKFGYVHFVFAKDSEPANLNEQGNYEADLYLIDNEGNKRLVLPYVNDYNGHVEFRILAPKEDSSMMGGSMPTYTRNGEDVPW